MSTVDSTNISLKENTSSKTPHAGSGGDSSSGGSGGGGGNPGVKDSSSGVLATKSGLGSKVGTGLGGATGYLANGGALNVPVLKVQLRDDIRRVPIHNEDITYDELLVMLERMFRGQLKSDDDIVIKYKDEDGDMISIQDSSDLTFAIQSCRVLKLRLYFKKDEGKNVLVKELPVGMMRSELRELRDRINRMLDLLEVETERKVTADAAGVQGGKTADVKAAAGTAPAGATAAMGREFDPLHRTVSPKPPETQQKMSQPMTYSGPPSVQTQQPQSAYNGPQSMQSQQQQPPTLRQQPQGAAGVEAPPSVPSAPFVQSQPPKLSQPSSQAYQQQPYGQSPAPTAPQSTSQTNLQQVGGYPTASTPSSVGYAYNMGSAPPAYNQYNTMPPPQPGAFTPQSRPSVGSAPMMGPPAPPPTQGQQGHYQQQPQAFQPPPQSVQQQQYPPPPQPNQQQQQYAAYAPPPPPAGGMAGPNNPYSRAPAATGYKQQ